MKMIHDRLRRTAAALALVLLAAGFAAAQDIDASTAMYKKLEALDHSKQAITREQVEALERAGVDAIIVPDLAAYPDFGRAVADLAGGRRAGE